MIYKPKVSNSEIKLEDWLMEDFVNLREEYDKENKDVYKNMYIRLIHSSTRERLENNELNENQFSTNEVCFLDFKLGISIFVNIYNEITPYFQALFDLKEWAIELRKDDNFRTFTKFCFYLIETIPQKN